MIKELLLQDEYYLEQLTLFLRNSYGIDEQQKMLVDILRQVNKTEDDIMNQLGAFIDSETALNIDYINSLDGDVSKLMDDIGSLLGISRNLTISCTTNILIDGGFYVFDDEQITLNNFEFFIYIACTIFNNNYDGTFKMASDLYDRLNTQDNPKAIRIIMLSDVNVSGVCNVYFDEQSPYGYVAGDTEETFNNRKNIYALFFSGLLTLTSMGITYKYDVLNISQDIDHKWSGYVNGEFQSHGVWGYSMWQAGEPLTPYTED
jgi:hypothetical protein